MMSLRAATVRDLPAIAEIEERSFPEGATESWSAESLAEFVGRRDVAFLVADDDGATVGYAISRFSVDEFELLRVAVAPERRREGIAASLLSRTTRDFGDFLERAGLESGKGWLEVRSDNAGAIALYSRIGFRERSVRKDYYGDGADALLMALDCFVR